MAGHRMAPSTLLPEPHPEAPVLRKDILDRHTESRADAGKGIDDEAD